MNNEELLRDTIARVTFAIAERMELRNSTEAWETMLRRVSKSNEFSKNNFRAILESAEIYGANYELN